MKMKSLLMFAALVLLGAKSVFAEDYMQVVVLESIDDKIAVFTSGGMAEKKKDAAGNAVRSLFYTLFYMGVDGINDGKPLITNNNEEYIAQFFNSRYSFYVRKQTELGEPEKSGKNYKITVRVEIPYKTLINDLKRNKVMEAAEVIGYEEVETLDAMVLPTIIVVPYKQEDESYESILAADYDRRVATSKVQGGFESRNITTIDLQAKIAAIKRRAEYESNSASSNDKELLLTSGADVYVVVDVKKDETTAGTRVSLIMKAYETSSGSILATSDSWTRRFNTSATDVLCSYAVTDNLQPFLDDICKNFTKRANNGSRVVLQFSIAESSMMTMSQPVGTNNYSLSNVIRQWVRKNAHQGKYHLQGVVDESMIFDYVMIPPKDADGLLMDAAQFAFLIESYLKEDEGVSCSSRVDGATIYITIE